MLIFLSTYLLSVSLLSGNTSGFDIYSHYLAYADLSNLQNVYKTYDFFGYVFPRYFLLSYIYEIITVIGLPFIPSVALLVSVPLFYISLYVREFSYSKAGGKNYRLILVILVSFVSLILTVYYSALSLSLLWFIAWLVSRKRFFIIGFFFHPLSAFSLVFLFLKSTWKESLTIFVLLFALSYFELFASSIQSKVHIDISQLGLSVVLLKPKEIGLMLSLFLVISLSGNRKLINDEIKPKFSATLLLMGFLVSMFVFFYTNFNDKETVFTFQDELEKQTLHGTVNQKSLLKAWW